MGRPPATTEASPTAPRVDDSGSDWLHVPRGRRWLIFTLILLAAAALRLAALTTVPPGVNQDEAICAWNTACLLKTGGDQYGNPWPIFYLVAMGDNRPLPQVYWQMPWQAALGMNLWSLRLPMVLLGLFFVASMVWLGDRLFGRPVGLIAGALTALNPWAFELSRLSLEAAFTPPLLAAMIAAAAAAGLPITLRDRRPRPRWGWALVAGVLFGLTCYGYHSVRPVLLLLTITAVLVDPRGWLALLRTRRGAVTIAAFALAAVAIGGPLVAQYVLQPEAMVHRGERILMWKRYTGVGTILSQMLWQYIRHFSVDFLFYRGDMQQIFAVPGVGMFHWFSLPLMLIGGGLLANELRFSPAARFVVIWILVYPIADSLAWSKFTHGLRSTPGLPVMLLLAALGGTWLLCVIAERGARVRRTALVSASLIVAGSTAWLAYNYFARFPLRHEVYRNFYADVQPICDWLRPRLADYDAVVVTNVGMDHGYTAFLFFLDYDPAMWFAEPRETLIKDDFFTYYWRIGKLYFPQPSNAADVFRSLGENGREDRVLMLFRPDVPMREAPLATFYYPDGSVAMKAYERRF